MEPNQTNSNMNTGGGSPSDGSFGPVVGLIIILVVIILGALYFWGQRTNETTDIYGNPVNSEETTDSSSDSLNTIEVDLNNTDTEGLDAELNAS